MDHVEYMTEQDAFFDFCLWDYKPVAPYKDKWRSATLLFHSFEVMGLHERIFDVVHAIRQGMGFSRTVWGLKRFGERIAWEFYFYDYRRRERERSMTRLLDRARPFIGCELRVNENLPYFMFSIDINKDLVSGTRELKEIHMYIGNPGSTVSSGICYSVTSAGMRLENFYFFFDAKKQMEDILNKMACSAYIDSTQVGLDRILWPQMRDCEVIVVANKQGNDAVYFSRIKVDQLIFFLKRMGYPEALVRFVEENRSRLDHLLYDVGYDYRMEGEKLVILKSGYYGVF